MKPRVNYGYELRSVLCIIKSDGSIIDGEFIGNVITIIPSFVL